MQVPGPGDSVPPCRSVLLGGVRARVCLDVCGHVRDECRVQLCVCGRVPCVTRARAAYTNVCVCSVQIRVCASLHTHVDVACAAHSGALPRGVSLPSRPSRSQGAAWFEGPAGCPPDPSPPPLTTTPIGARGLRKAVLLRGGSVPRGCRDLNHVSLRNSKHLAKDK